MSPYFFALYIDSVYEKVRATGLGCHLKWHCMSILLYADDIILLAPSVCTLQRLLSVCESELELLDMSLNTSKSVCMRVGSRFNRPCSKLTANDGRELVWTDCMKYLGIYIKSASNFRCSLDNAKKSFYRAFNAAFGKVGRIASDTVVVEILSKKCCPILYYGVLIVVTLLVRRSSQLTLSLTAHSVRYSTHDLVILFVSVCQCSNFYLLPPALLDVSVISYVG